MDRYRRVVEAFARRDLDAFAKLLHPDVDFASAARSLRAGTIEVTRGSEAVEIMFRLFSKYRAEIQRSRIGDVTLRRLRLRGQGMESGAPMEQTQWHVVEWLQGTVVRWRTLRSEAQALEAAGMSD